MTGVVSQINKCKNPVFSKSFIPRKLLPLHGMTLFHVGPYYLQYKRSHSGSIIGHVMHVFPLQTDLLECPKLLKKQLNLKPINIRDMPFEGNLSNFIIQIFPLYGI